MSAKPILYGIDMSPPVRAVKLTLKALNVDFEFKNVDVHADEHKKPEYLKKNPQHTIPMLEDDGKYLWDSHAICAYLASKYGKDDTLYPKDFYQRAVVDQRLHYENGVIFMTTMKQHMVPVIRGTPNEEQIKQMMTSINDTYDMLESFLGAEPYFAGKNLTIADLSITSSVSSLIGIAPLDQSKRPKLAAWMERMQKLPYYEEANGKGVNCAAELFKTKLAALKV